VGTYKLISFDDLAPANLTLLAIWNDLGFDDQGRVYLGMNSVRSSDNRQDLAVFRYDPETGDREYVGSFMEASEEAGNLLDGEEIPKGHTHLINIDGDIYLGSQGFHDFKWEIDTLPNYRGAHLYRIDTASNQMSDISASLPNGILAEHQGIIALDHTNLGYAGDHHLLAGLLHPLSDIVLFDYESNTVEKIVPGIPWQLGNPLSREVIVTRSGKIYTYRGTEEPSARDQVFNVWVYDMETDAMTETSYTCTGGFWDGMTKTADEDIIYFSTSNGELYRLDATTDVFTHLTHFLPTADYDNGIRNDYFYAVTLSWDETRIYGIPSETSGGEQLGGNLYAYDIDTGEVSLVMSLGQAIYTGGDMRDSHGNIYFGRHGGGGAWDGDPRLLVVHVGTEE
jgi:outer membrane protein assembly factor BamB